MVRLCSELEIGSLALSQTTEIGEVKLALRAFMVALIVGGGEQNDDDLIGPCRRPLGGVMDTKLSLFASLSPSCCSSSMLRNKEGKELLEHCGWS